MASRLVFWCLNIEGGVIRNHQIKIEEKTVAKRRNLKKEKAARNRAYARQFRSNSSRDHYSRRREKKTDEEQGQSQQKSENNE